MSILEDLDNIDDIIKSFEDPEYIPDFTGIWINKSGNRVKVEKWEKSKDNIYPFFSKGQYDVFYDKYGAAYNERCVRLEDDDLIERIRDYKICRF